MITTGGNNGIIANPIAQINASTETARINGVRLIIDGTCTFTAGYDPSTKLAPGSAATDVNTNVTTIDGGKITALSITASQIQAGTITVAKLNFTPLTSGGAATDINNNPTTIDGQKITTNTLDANTIRSSALSAKTITLDSISSIIQTSNFVANSTGWQIKGTGDAEFNNCKVRGTLYTSTIAPGNTLTVQGGITITSGTIQSGNYSSGTSGWKIDYTGNAEFNNCTVRGSLQTPVYTSGTTGFTVAASGVHFSQDVLIDKGELIIQGRVTSHSTMGVDQNITCESGYITAQTYITAKAGSVTGYRFIFNVESTVTTPSCLYMDSFGRLCWNDDSGTGHLIAT